MRELLRTARPLPPPPVPVLKSVAKRSINRAICFSFVSPALVSVDLRGVTEDESTAANVNVTGLPAVV